MLLIELSCAESPSIGRAAGSRTALSLSKRREPALAPRRGPRDAGGGLTALALRCFGRRLRCPCLGGRCITGDSHHAVPAAGELLLRPLLSRLASAFAPVEALRPYAAGLAASPRRQAEDQVDFDNVLLADDLLFDRHRRPALGGACCDRGGRSVWDVVRGEAANRAERRSGPCCGTTGLGEEGAVNLAPVVQAGVFNICPANAVSRQPPK